MTAAKPSATIRYTAMRIGIFIGCLVFVALLVHFGVLPKGLGDSNFVWVLLLAIVISAPLSYVLLRRQRDEMSEQIVTKVDEAKAKLEASRSREDRAAQ
ncbi:DUF4229 domain-containing protein [Streptomyces sp. AK02-01A]|uniref:DUF4229 domain-containing protein n=1 Tax=Streptomyces sp. AK02-01A TaxID=3028648 RepID=UPI0029B9FC4F|nr:DUF4229 domain-containing protein [Streptomyces sp. AK02-01A]MDX3851146.1 DUF4229 domain-containing protein [Streptomyces sp. AK02-01A]